MISGYRLRKYLFRGWSALGGGALMRWATRASPRIFMYHRFGPRTTPEILGVDEFERQVLFLKKHFVPMTLGELVNVLREHGEAPPRAAVITVDDGYRDFYDFAWPILRKHGVPASFYVTTGFVDGEVWLWPDQLRHILEHAPPGVRGVEFGGHILPVDLGNAVGRATAWKALVEQSFTLTDVWMRQAIVDLARSIGCSLPQEPPIAYAPATWPQLRELSAGGIEIGGHSSTHPSLTRVAVESLDSEIRDAKRRAEMQIDRVLTTFCYPNGGPSDVSAAVKAAIQTAGFTAAAVAYHDGSPAIDLYELRRYPMHDDMYEFGKATAGVRHLSARFGT